MNLRINTSSTVRLQNVQYLDRCANQTIEETARKTDAGIKISMKIEIILKLKLTV